MNEEQWLAATDPTAMLEALRAFAPASQRKLRLLLCASCRPDWAHFQGSIKGRAVETAERLADGPGPKKELQAVRQGLARLLEEEMGWRDEDMEVLLNAFQGFGFGDDPAKTASMTATLVAAVSLTPTVTTSRVRQALAMLASPHPWAADGRRKQYKVRQCQLLRDLFGTPFRPSPPLSPSLLTWRDGLIPKLAEAAYENRLLPSGHFDEGRVAVLADALEEAGCTDAEILGHLREPGAVHVRGCHAVDLVLNKG